MSPMSPRLLRPRATGFSPTQIAGLAAWWDASDSSTVTTASGAVSEWRSKAGTATATQGTAANRPAYTGTQNGKNVITFDGSNDYLTTSTLTIPQPYTIAWSGRSNGAAPGGASTGPYVCDGSTSTTRVALFWNGDGVSASNGRLGIFAGGTSIVQPASGTQAYNAWSVVAAAFNSASSLLRADGVQVAAGGISSNSITALVLGDRYNTVAGAATPFNGPWGDFLIYNRALSTAELQKLEGYLAWKWGLQASLPYDHPYAASFPGYGTQATPSDADALAYLSAVRTADGGTGVEVGVANAVDSFVKGCKSDGIWSAIKASCILAGARTLSGALVPLAGSAPTNVNFVAADYNRKTGLVGNGSTKYLNTNRANNADGQNDSHMSLYASSAATNAGGTGGAYAGGGGGASNSYNSIVRWNALGAFDAISAYCRTGNFASVAGKNTVGFIGMSRSASASFVGRGGGSNTTVSQTSLTPNNNSIALFAENDLGVVGRYSDVRLAFYSIGSSIDLALLDARVTNLINAIGAAI